MNIEIINEMEQAGFTREQAMVLGKVIEGDLATKQDIEGVRSDLKRDIEGVRSELKRDIKELDAKIEVTKAELKRDIAELDGKIETTKAELKRDIETTKAELKRDIKEIESRLSMKMIITSGGFAFAMLTALVTLAKLGLMAPSPQVLP